ncbi:MAG: site-specific DNA-methyltransferase [Actinomycetota bacterium]|nr:site-specific DNA-methyltransferase [Actinomycetota bacterium]MDQ6944793.1 site-specific DNA-methyltransferase [Actinomycetota bacterium]
MMLRTERDVVKSLAGRAVTLAELYAQCESAGVAGRDDGLAPIEGFGTDQRYKRRVRCVLQDLAKAGKAHRVAQSTWVIDGSRAAPRRCLLVICGEPSHLQLVLADAARLLDGLDEAADLVVADPPWALQRQVFDDAERDRGERLYRRDSSLVVPGYVDVAEDDYREFTERWVEAAAAALRPGAYLSIITGPSAAARVQVAAEDAGLSFVNQVVARRPFALQTRRRLSHAHTVVTVMCAGPVTSPRRFFAVPADLPRAASGAAYPLDFWPDMTKPEERPGQLRYDNTLPELLVRRCVHALTPGPENGGEPWQALVVDPFLGGGATAVVAHREQRRFVGGDVNVHSLRYVMARMAETWTTPAEQGAPAALQA